MTDNYNIQDTIQDFEDFTHGKNIELSMPIPHGNSQIAPGKWPLNTSV